MMKRLLKTLAGLAVVRMGLMLIGIHPLGGILALIAAGFLILDGISQLL